MALILYQMMDSCLRFYCFGYKNSSALVEKFSTDYDIGFLCQHCSWGPITRISDQLCTY